jgi:thiol-disulfide isomerase/thioredoxin
LGILAVGAGADRVVAQDGPWGFEAFESGTLTTVTGQTIHTDSLAGKVVLFNAWATWCGPCVTEMPSFQRVADEFGPRGFMVLGVSADQDGPEAVKAFVENLGVTYPIFLVPQPLMGRLTSRVRGLPTSFLIGRDGRVVSRVEGVFAEEDLRAAVERLLEEGDRLSSRR